MIISAIKLNIDTVVKEQKNLIQNTLKTIQKQIEAKNHIYNKNIDSYLWQEYIFNMQKENYHASFVYKIDTILSNINTANKHKKEVARLRIQQLENCWMLGMYSEMGNIFEKIEKDLSDSDIPLILKAQLYDLKSFYANKMKDENMATPLSHWKIYIDELKATFKPEFSLCIHCAINDTWIEALEKYVDYLSITKKNHIDIGGFEAYSFRKHLRQELPIDEILRQDTLYQESQLWTALTTIEKRKIDSLINEDLEKTLTYGTQITKKFGLRELMRGTSKYSSIIKMRLKAPKYNQEEEKKAQEVAEIFDQKNTINFVKETYNFLEIKKQTNKGYYTEKDTEHLYRELINRTSRLLKKPDLSNYSGVKSELEEMFDNFFAIESIQPKKKLAALSLLKSYYTYQIVRQQDSIQELSIQKIQESLDSTESYLDFYTGEKHSFVIHITKDTFEYQELSITKKVLDSILIDFHRDIFTGRETHTETYKRLYNRIIGNLQQAIKPHLIISPSNELVNLPFDILVNKEGRYMIEDHSISYTYSPQLYLFTQEQEYHPLEKALGIMDDYEGVEGYEYLGYVKNTADGLDDLMNIDIHLNQREVKNFVESMDSTHLLHLALHAKAGRLADTYIALVGEDNTIYKQGIKELDNQRLTVNHCFLGACSTSDGQRFESEGIMSLNKAFFQAGVRTILSSLWGVTDKESSKIATEYYRQLQKGKRPSVALQKAKKKYLQEAERQNKHPYNWANYQLIGKDDPITIPEKRQNYTWFFVGGLFLVIGGLGVAKYRVGKNTKTQDSSTKIVEMYESQ